MRPQLPQRLGFLFAFLLASSLAHGQPRQVEPMPAATPAIQRLLDETAKTATAGDAAKARALAGEAAAAARLAADASGEAQAERIRAEQFVALNQPAEALAAWRSAEAAWRRIEDGPGQVQALGWQAVLESESEAPAREQHLARAIAIAEVEAARPRAAVGRLIEITPALFDRGRMPEARRVFEAAITVLDRVGPGSSELAESLGNLGVVAYFMSDFKAARRHLERALEIQERIEPDSVYLASSLNRLGTTAQMEGDLAGARVFFERCITLTARIAPRSDREANCLGNLGSVVRDQGDLATALEYYERAQALFHALAPDSLEEATGFGDLGVVLWRQGDLMAARRYQMQALAIREKLAPGSRDLAASLNDLALVATDQGDLESALDYHRRAQEIQERIGPSLGLSGSLNAIGGILGVQGDSAAAKTFHVRALAMSEAISPGSLWVASSLGSLGSLARRAGDFDEAEQYYKRALEIHERLSPGSLDVALDEDMLGLVASARGDVFEAEAHHRRALVIREARAPNAIDSATSLGALADLADRAGRLDSALDLASRAWSVVAGQSASVFGDEARQAFESEFHAVNRRLVRLQVKAGRVDDAFETAEQGRARALLQLLAERGIARRLAPPDLWQRYELAQAAANRAGKALEAAGEAQAQARALASSASADQTEAQERALNVRERETAEARQAYARARVEAERHWTEVRGSIADAIPEAIATAVARRSLPPGAVLVSFTIDIDEAGGTLFVLEHERPVRAFPISFVDLATRVAAIRRPVARDATVRGFRRVGSDESRVNAARELFQGLFPVGARRAIEKATRLLIVPDGVLWDVPFAALVMNERGKPRYLGLEKPLVYAQSLTTFVHGRRTAASPRSTTLSALVVGNPWLGEIADRTPDAARESVRASGELAVLSRDGTVPSPLPYAETEARQVAALYGVQPAVGSEPTEAWFRSRAGKADIIHLATHGYFSSFRAMGSGLRLAPPAAPGDSAADDGALQAWEVMTEIPLSAALVVLSACESGVGSKVAGEGLVGLTRAFQIAGAASILATQWSVSDESTAVAMVSFHKNLRRGMARDEALRQAMRRVAGDPKTSHPYYWAPFLLVGDFEPLAGGRR